MKYLLKDYGYEQCSYHGFETDLSVEVLTERLNEIIHKLDKYDESVFMGYRVINCPEIFHYKIMTLDEFWNSVFTYTE